jgi:hypothetical protein
MRLHTLVATQGDSATAIRNPVGDRQQTALLQTVILLFIKIRRRDGQTQLILSLVFRSENENEASIRYFTIGFTYFSTKSDYSVPFIHLLWVKSAFIKYSSAENKESPKV